MEVQDERTTKKICRTCLRIDTGENLQNLFPKGRSPAEGTPLPDMISECSNYSVKEDDEYPNQICKKCVEDIRVAYDFKKQCAKSHEILTSVIEKYKKNTPNSGNISDEIFISELYVSAGNTGIQAEVIVYYPCEKCSEKFLTFDNLKKHLEKNHLEETCRVCSKTITRIKETDAEVSESDDGRSAPSNDLCKTCNSFYAKSAENCDDEAAKESSEIPWQYMCAACMQPFSSDESLKNHPCEENCTTSVKSEKSLEESGIEDVENPLALETFSSSSKFGNSDTESFDGDRDDKDGACTTDDDGKPLCELQGKVDKSTDMSKNSKKYRKLNKRKRKIHRCDVCTKVFSRSTHLKRHALTHSDEKPFSCTVCSKGFTRIDHLNIHMHHHSETKPHCCEICKRGFTRAEHLRKHKEARHGNKVKTPKTEFCEICKKGFTTVKYLHIHMRSHTDRIWSCKLCAEKFKTKPELTAHSKTHAASEKPFLCSECGLRFVRNDYLVIHMRRHKGEKPYKCKFCGKGFPRATDLTVHERYHTGEKTHLCTICGKGFQRAYNLLVHMRVHTGERPYQCPHCSKRFAQGNDLKAHIRRHTGERFKCEICGDGFIQGYHLTQHKRNVHGIDMKSHIRRVEKYVTPTEQQKQMEALQTQLLEHKPDPEQLNAAAAAAAARVNDKNFAEVILGEVDIIKIEDEPVDVTEAISLSAEQAEMLENGQEITVVGPNNVTMISYFSPTGEKVKFDANSSE